MIHTMTEYVGAFIVALVSILIIFFLIDHFTGGKLIKTLVCATLFWVPFGAASAMNCYAIPV